MADLSAELERALTVLVRRGRLVPLHEDVAAETAVILERALYQVLAVVGDRAPVRISDVAGGLAVDVSTASRQVALLEQRGLLERVPDPTDGRASLLALTTTGGSVLTAYRRARRRLVTAALEGWPADDVARLVALLDRFNADLARADQARGAVANRPHR